MHDDHARFLRHVNLLFNNTASKNYHLLTIHHLHTARPYYLGRKKTTTRGLWPSLSPFLPTPALSCTERGLACPQLTCPRSAHILPTPPTSQPTKQPVPGPRCENGCRGPKAQPPQAKASPFQVKGRGIQVTLGKPLWSRVCAVGCSSPCSGSP